MLKRSLTGRSEQDHLDHLINASDRSIEKRSVYDTMFHASDSEVCPLTLIMNFLLQKLASLKIGWNERPLTEADLYALCKRFKITIEEMPLRVSGFYYCVMGRHFIAVNSGLSTDKKLFVLFHEFAHFLLHAPDRGATANFHGIGRRDRKEIEADLVALVALMPKSMIVETDAAILIEDGIAPDLVAERLSVYERYGI